MPDGPGDAVPGSAPSLIDTADPRGMTWTNVWPMVSVTGLPLRSKNWVGFASAVFFHVPTIVVPFVAIQALPLPTTFASRRFLFGWPSLSGPNYMSMTTTFFGATRSPVDASTCISSPVTERR